MNLVDDFTLALPSRVQRAPPFQLELERIYEAAKINSHSVCA